MRHLEKHGLLDLKSEPETLVKVETLPNLLEDFPSDESFIGNDLDIPFSPSSTSSESVDTPTKQNETRRSRRKSLIPQRAVQAENSQSMGNSSECSQDAPDVFFNIYNQLSTSSSETHHDFFDIPEGEDLLQDIDEENIFKGIQEETGGETIDEEMIDNVKEEWRAHWGVKCNMCEKVFTYKAEYDKHYMESYNLAPVYTCTFCNKSSDKYTTFRSHCYRHTTEGRYKCRDCSKGFSLQSMLHVHVLSKHTKSKPFVCEECGKSFVTKPGLKIHVKKHKTETKEEYPCVECGKVLHTRGGLTSHMNVHRLGRRFMCDVCGKTFTQKVNMQQHVKQHTGDKPHECDKCGKTFAEKSHLARHYSFHSDERPFKCDVCQKMYKTERCLKVHSLVHASARPFVCSYCSKGFLSSTKLKQHYNIHTGERPYKCKYCEKTFTNYPNWLKHTRRRHKVNHKTGEVLEPKPPKEEPPATPLAEELPATTSDASESPIILDFQANKSDENGFVSLCEGGSSDFSNMTFLVPYFQQPSLLESVPSSQQQLSVPLQFSDLVPMQYLQQTLPCD